VTHERELQRVTVFLLACFFIAATASAYWIVSGGSVTARGDNPRLLELARRIERGTLYDRDGGVIAYSFANANGIIARHYPVPAMYSAVGYYTLDHGTGGIEAQFDDLLSGASRQTDLSAQFERQVLHRPQQGVNLQTTLDTDLQTSLNNALRNTTASAVIIHVPTGDVLASVSMPTFDPNLLDAQWDTLQRADVSPYINRAIEPTAYAGGALQTAWMIAALLQDINAEAQFENATAPLTIDDWTLECSVRLPQTSLTLRESYAFACPSAFDDLTRQLGDPAMQNMLDVIRQLPTLESPDSVNTFIERDDLGLESVGLGTTRFSTLQMALLASAIINDGNAPLPRLVLEQQAPDRSDWVPLDGESTTIPITTAATARQIQDFMRYNVANGAAQNAGRPSVDVGGHVSLTYNVEGQPSVWFIGFSTFGNQEGVAIAILLENSSDTGLAADIAGETLALAREIFAPHSP
jgi:penicillin-binding protein A